MDDKEQAIINHEKEKYSKIWNMPQYTLWSPECAGMDKVIKWISNKPIRSVLVCGCGEGHGLHKLALAGYQVTGLDLVNVIKYPELKEKFIEAPLWEIPVLEKFDLVLAMDVLEHIPSEYINKTMQELNRVSKYFYFTISCKSDTLGALVGESLHLIVEKPSWWIDIVTMYLKISSFEGSPGSLNVCGMYRE